MNILLTGTTGLVGSELARTLLADPTLTRLYVVIRRHGNLSAQERLTKLYAQWDKFLEPLPPGVKAKVSLIEHDLAGPLPALDPNIDYIVHSAASTDLSTTLDAGRRANLYATQRVLDAARTLPNLKSFVHLSTAYVCGRRQGLIREGDAAPRRFHNDYERTKREAEACVRASDLPWMILRPSMIVGRSDNGYVVQMKVIYAVWRIWLMGVLWRAPFAPKAWVDIVPIDYVVSATLALMRDPRALGQTLHLCAGAGRQRARTILKCATAVFGVPPPKLFPLWIAQAYNTWPLKATLPHRLRELLNYMYWHLPYLAIRDRLYDTTATDQLLAGKVERPDFARYGERLFAFCRDTEWGKRSLRCSASTSPANGPGLPAAAAASGGR